MFNLSAKIGIDVGGTNTDATLVVDGKLRGEFKTPTTHDITTGVITAISSLISQTQFPTDKISSINIGTTHLVNACIQQKGLNKVMVIRLAGQATTALPPCSDWPEDVREKITGDETYIADGGFEYDGRVIADVNLNQIRWAACRAKAQGIHSIAIVGVFANVNPSQEKEVKAFINEIYPEMHITLSHEMGGLGLIARENATIVNASSIELFKQISEAFKKAITQLSFNTEVFLTFGDGTKTPLDDDTSTPLRTFHSGPINSIRGAAILAGVSDAVTVDIGGTSSDVGLLIQGKPVNENSSFLITGLGVQCNFTLPRLNSFGLGGGTIVKIDDSGKITFGPDSVGHELSRQALVFGGSVLTLTDIAVAFHRISLGTVNQATLKQKISAIYPQEDIEELLKRIDNAMHKRLYEGILETLASIEKHPPVLVLVGGGSVLFDLNALQYCFQKKFQSVLIPQSGGVANALGAAMSKIGGKFVQVYDYEKIPQDQAIADATEKAKSLALAKGAYFDSPPDPEVTQTELNYLKGRPHEITVRVVGDDSGKMRATPLLTRQITPIIPSEKVNFSCEMEPLISTAHTKASDSSQAIQLIPGAELLDITMIQDIIKGAGLLGSGGGGSPISGLKLAHNALKRGESIFRISLDDLPDDALVVVLGAMGSPVVGDERPPTIEEGVKALRAFEDKYQQKVKAIVLLEGGGFNGSYPLFVAAAVGIPVVDADCMGRAFPGIDMVTPNIYGDFDIHYAALSNGRSSVLVQGENKSFASLEHKARQSSVELGGSATLAYMPMTGAQAKKWTIKGTLSIAEKMGRALRHSSGLPLSQQLEALNGVLLTTDYQQARLLFEGTIKGVNSNNKEMAGFNIGGYIIENQEKDQIMIGFQNENIIVINSATGEVLAQVPDLITIVDPNNFEVISCGEYRYGQNVVVLTMKAPALMATEKALKVVGPSAFPIDKIMELLKRL